MSELQTITLGGGCFWCTEAVFVKVRGVTDVESGYCNGHVVKPSLREILEIFFVIHDPTTLNRQGNDAGTQYRSGIYFSTPEQGEIATNMLADMTQGKVFGRPIVTEVLALSNYWPAEDYHQDFFERNPFQGYCVAVAAPKVEKFRKTFARLVKA